MRVPVAYVEEYDDTLEIFETSRRYLAQKPPRKKFTFFCADKECRTLLRPRMKGVNYWKDPTTDVSRCQMHFKRNPRYPHRVGCPYMELASADGQSESSERTLAPSRSVPPRERIITLFQVPLDWKDFGIFGGRFQAEYSSVVGIPQPDRKRQRIDALHKRYRARTEYLSEVVTSFEQMSDAERASVRLCVEEVNGRQYEMSYAQFFRRPRQCIASRDRRVYYGDVLVTRRTIKKPKKLSRERQEVSGYSIGFIEEARDLSGGPSRKVSTFLEDPIFEADPILGQLLISRCQDALRHQRRRNPLLRAYVFADSVTKSIWPTPTGGIPYLNIWNVTPHRIVLSLKDVKAIPDKNPAKN